MWASAARKRKVKTSNLTQAGHDPSAASISTAESSPLGKKRRRRIKRHAVVNVCAFRKRYRVVLMLCAAVLLILETAEEVWTQVSISRFPKYRVPLTTVPLEQANIAVVSLHNGFKYHGSLGRGYLSRGGFFQNNKRSYAHHHGYAYVDTPRSENDLVPLEPWQQEGSRPIYYQKPRLLLYLMEEYKNLEWLLWIDGDAIITQPYIRIEDRIQEFQQLHRDPSSNEVHHEIAPASQLCLVWAEDSMPNAGILLLRNSQTSRELLRKSLVTYQDVDFFRKFTDQASLTVAIQRNETYQNCQLLLQHSKSYSPTLLQSRVRGPDSWRWKPGHWILHLPNHNRFELMASLGRVGEKLKQSPIPLFKPIAKPKLEGLSKERRKRFEAVRGSIRHAWNSYDRVVCVSSSADGGLLRRKANSAARPNRLASHIPADDLSPLTQTGKDWLHHAATLHDSLDTLVLAGLDEEYNAAISFLLRQDVQATALLPTKTFEYSLRIIGGLLGAFSLTGDERLLLRARDAADALLQSPFRSSPTALPRMFDVLFPPSHAGNFLYKVYARMYQWGRDTFTSEHHFNSLAGVGSFSLEFYFLSNMLGNDNYRKAADGIFEHVGKYQQQDGIVPSHWNVMTGLPTSNHGSLGSGSDSFYEYLLKVPLAVCSNPNGSFSCEKDDTLQQMLTLYKKVVKNGLRSKHVFKPNVLQNTKDDTPLLYPVDQGDRFQHLLCFVPGMLALGAKHLEQETNNREDWRNSDLALSKALLWGCYSLYNRTETGFAPEQIQVSRNKRGQRVEDMSYLLRPEYVESLFILYRVTGDSVYQEMGWDVFEHLERFCKTVSGYVGLRNVSNAASGGGHIDDMPSYFIAETLKYLLLLFGPDDYVSLDDFVFSTEAHPIRRIPNRSTPYFVDEVVGCSVRVPFPWRLWLLVAGIPLLLIVLLMSLLQWRRIRRDSCIRKSKV